MTTDIIVTDEVNAVFGKSTFLCSISHNEDGAMLDYELPCGIIPIAVATCTHNSESHLLFVALRDFPAMKLSHYEDGCDGVCEDIHVKAGKAYFTLVSHIEDQEPSMYREYPSFADVYPRETHEDTEWMDGMIARHLMTGYDYSK